MSTQDFVHLHVHTEYSLLDGLSEIGKLVGRAKELDMRALAITDHGAMYGVMDFYRAAKKAGVQPVIGMEGYLAPRRMTDKDPKLDKSPSHLLMLAMNNTGYKNLCRIASVAQLEGYYYRPRIDRDFLAAHSEGLIVTSGCLAAEIPGMIMEGREDAARDLIDWHLQVFGRDRFYLELQQHDIPELKVVNDWLIDIGKRDDLRFLATNDVHYVLKTDYEAHDTLLCIQTGALKSEDKAKRMSLSDNSYYLSDQAEMWATFGHIRDGEALTSSLAIAEMCADVNLDDKTYHLPIFTVPDGFTEPEYLRYLCEKGLRWRYGDRASHDAALLERFNFELETISRMGFNTYFLIVWDLCEFARHADIWWNVRGSGAGSLALYCLGITNIDPIQNNLLFERFLNPGRVTMPDIDMDFPDDRRGEMIDYTVRKYGEDKVAAIITFGTMGAKAAVRDVARAFGLDLSVVNQAVGMIPTEPKPKPIPQYIEDLPDLKKLVNSDAQLKGVMEVATLLQGMNRHTSVHAAGVIVADQPLVEYLPLARQTREDERSALKQVTQFPMETAESIGLLKIDFLGLSTLTIVRRASDLIHKHHGVRYTMDNIPYRPSGDPEEDRRLEQAFELLSRGDTIGVFQVESTGMQSMLRDMRPSKFEHIVAAVALYRPGPMDYIPTYNARMHGDEPVLYHHPGMARFLEETYGIMVYQEQIMQVASGLFGYSLGEADLMRRAVSKKKKEDLQKHRVTFEERGPQVDPTMTKEIAGKIFDDIEFFANYGFNKSHAADYAVITVQSAFLKAHYTPEYMAALLSVYFDDKDKVTACLAECKRLGISILPPSINHSVLDFDIEYLDSGERAIRFGLAAIKNAGIGALSHLIQERDRAGAYASLDDLCRRVDLRQVGKKALESLIMVGALDIFGTRPTLLNALERLMQHSTTLHRTKEMGQSSLFGDSAADTDDLLSHLPHAGDATVREMLNWEKDLLGLYLSSHPIDPVMELLKDSNIASSTELHSYGPDMHERPVRFVGLITGIRRTVTKSKDMMAIVTLEDKYGTVSAVLFPKTWTRLQESFVEGEVIHINGTLDLKRGEPQIIVDRATQSFDFVVVQRDAVEDGFRPIMGDQPAPPAYAPPAYIPPPDDIDDDGYVADSSQEPEWPSDEAGVSATQVTTVSMAAPPVSASAAPAPAPAYVPPELMFESERAAQTTRMITIRFLRNGDITRDRMRLERLIGALRELPGTDTFEIAIAQKDTDEVEWLDFDFTTCWGEELQRKLERVSGVEVVRVG